MDSATARHYYQDKIDEIFSKTADRGYRIGFGTIIIQDIIEAAVKSGLVQYAKPVAPGSFDEIEAAKKMLEGYYFIEVGELEMGGSSFYYLLIKADNYEDAKKVVMSTRSDRPHNHNAYGEVGDYSWYTEITHGKPTPQMLLKPAQNVSVIWLDKEIEKANAQKAASEQSKLESNERFENCPHTHLEPYARQKWEIEQNTPLLFWCTGWQGSCGNVRPLAVFEACKNYKKN